MRRSEGQRLEAEQRKHARAKAAALRAAAREARAEARTLSASAKAKGPRVAKVRGLCAAARAAAREAAKRRRAEVLAALRAEYQSARAALHARCAQDRSTIRASMKDRRKRARALREVAAAQSAEARRLLALYRAAQSRPAEQAAETVALVADAIERSGAHPAYLDRWRHTSTEDQRRAVADARAWFRGKHGRKRRPRSDELAGRIVEQLLELSHGRAAQAVDEVESDLAREYYDREHAAADAWVAEQVAAREARAASAPKPRRRRAAAVADVPF